MLKKAYRITKESEFRAVRLKGRIITTPFFLLQYKKNDKKNSRIGFVVSKKVSQNATERNTIKRRMREIVRGYPEILRRGYDVVCIAKKQIGALSFQKMKEEMRTALHRICI